MPDNKWARLLAYTGLAHFRSPVSTTFKIQFLPSASCVLPQERAARMIGFYQVIHQDLLIKQVFLAVLVTLGNAPTALQTCASFIERFQHV